ncbi:MAG: TlpA family protein disulfide reductase [SAR324 cluster bacterium]|nr:TlpA family protein disulfide reductase [SAR324 cluster bacterium]
MRYTNPTFFFLLFCLLVSVTFSSSYGHHTGTLKPKPANPALNLTAKEEHVLKDQFIELPGTPIDAENFQGVPVNKAQPELFSYQNKFILLNFWATWCVPCLKELPDMERLHQKLGKKGLVILAVAMGENKQKVKKFLKKHNLHFPILADPEMTISELYGVKNLPTTFLIDRNKVIIGRALGPRQWSNPDLVEFFRKRIEVP